ncbi:Fatty acid-binding protein [Calidithermus terrae]|uniref:Fatty acid-binding protein n=1 Tax=Calidithermus terrae TaxID=1408545 RepID=A0A399F0P5_9DEIN|nr:DegV family protein [Calidithermus terrae]RIH90357.1 Fatty acid-binding protein [Calidithermus terrae]
MKIALVTDSTSDLPPAQAQTLGVQVVPLYVNFKGKVHKDWVEIRPADIFEGVRAGAEMPSSSQPSPQDFKEAYERALQNADHVLSIHISSKLSGTAQSAQLAAAEFPGRITVFDSLAASQGIGMMVERAKEMLDQGADLRSVMTELERMRADHKVLFSLATLEYLKKNGRIGGAQALLGGLLGIKPILTIKEGRVEPAGRARGEKKALAEVVEGFKTWAQGRKHIRIYYLYNGDASAVAAFKEAINGSGLPVEERSSSEVGAVISTHTGPGLYGFYAYSL